MLSNTTQSHKYCLRQDQLKHIFMIFNLLDLIIATVLKSGLTYFGTSLWVEQKQLLSGLFFILFFYHSFHYSNIQGLPVFLLKIGFLLGTLAFSSNNSITTGSHDKAEKIAESADCSEIHSLPIHPKATQFSK